jgi:hypothetical protein
MLDQEKKILIEAEERYRHEIALKLRSELKSLEGEIKTAEKRIWGKIEPFLNSNLGMWLLSSVLITGGAGLYQIMQHRYEEKIHSKTQLIVLQFEIANRIENMRYFWRKATTVGDGVFALKSVFQSKTPINPDVEKINLSVLYFNLYQLIGHQNRDVLMIVRVLEDMEYELQALKPSAPLSEEIKNKGLDLIFELEKALVNQASNLGK